MAGFRSVRSKEALYSVFDCLSMPYITILLFKLSYSIMVVAYTAYFNWSFGTES